MTIKDYMKEHLLYLDGGLGTLLQQKGLRAGEHPERWNLSHPDVLVDIHRRYFEAGSNVVSANTFGANLLKFDEAELDLLIGAAMDNVRKARDTAKGNAGNDIF